MIFLSFRLANTCNCEPCSTSCLLIKQNNIQRYISQIGMTCNVGFYLPYCCSTFFSPDICFIHVLFVFSFFSASLVILIGVLF